MTVKRKRAPVPKIQEVTEEIGRVYKTNNCGDVVVVKWLYKLFICLDLHWY